MLGYPSFDALPVHVGLKIFPHTAIVSVLFRFAVSVNDDTPNVMYISCTVDGNRATCPT